VILCRAWARSQQVRTDGAPPILGFMLAFPRRSRPRSSALAVTLLCLVGFALQGCESPINVAIDVDPGADMASWQTYAWISEEPLIPQVNGVTEGPPISPIDDQRIRTAVDTRLGSKGWKQVEDRDQADLVVSYGIGRTRKTEFYETPNTGGYYGRHGYRYGGWYGGSTVQTKQYTEGTLTIEFFDRRTKQAAWVGWASKRLSGSSSKREEVIERAVEKILQEFPDKS
jgi:hypothetical protein